MSAGEGRGPGAPPEEARFWAAGDLDGLELLRATYVTHAFARHVHEGFAIGVVEAGAQAFSHGGTTHTAPAGSIIVVNPQEPHTGRAAVETGYTYRMLYPEAGLLERAARELKTTQGVPAFPEPVVRDDALAGLLRAAHVSLEAPVARLERQSRLLWALAHLIRRHADLKATPSRAGKERRAVGLVREYIAAHHAENVSLEELSRAANLSPFHLLRVFGREVGLPPHAYLTGVRLNRVKALLAAGEPIGRAAAATGFFDQSHLTKAFKRALGYTPGQYARGLDTRSPTEDSNFLQ